MQILGKCNLIDIRRMRDRYSKHFTFKKAIFLDIYEEAYIISLLPILYRNQCKRLTYYSQYVVTTTRFYSLIINLIK